jgi:hypothetical protein
MVYLYDPVKRKQCTCQVSYVMLRKFNFVLRDIYNPIKSQPHILHLTININ